MGLPMHPYGIVSIYIYFLWIFHPVTKQAPYNFHSPKKQQRPNLVGPFLGSEHLRWQVQAQDRHAVARVTLGHAGGEATATTQVQLPQGVTRFVTYKRFHPFFCWWEKREGQMKWQSKIEYINH